MKLLRFFLIAGVFTILAVPAASPNLYAQTELKFKRVIKQWPTVELFFTASCNGQQVFNLNKQNFRVVEDGIEIPDYTLECPSPLVHCPSSVALVFDASSSMAGQPNADAKTAGHSYVSQMNGTTDEAAVMWVTSVVTVAQGMTSNKASLDNAIDNLPASGMAAIWDGIYAGVEEVIANGNNSCRAVIAMTDGYDNSSTHIPDEIISLANHNRIRIYTIGLGAVSAGQLETISLLTGGRYYQSPTSAQLVSIFQEISTIIFNGFGECVITYQASCADGGIRVVDLTLQNLCSGTDTQSLAYRASRDTSTFSSIDLTIGDGMVRGGHEVTVPLELLTATTGYFNKCSFDVLFSNQYLQFKSFATPQGAILEGLPIDIDPIPGGVKITVKEKVLRSGPGLLGEITLMTADVPDTVLTDVKLANWVFSAGCYKPALSDGKVAIVPRAPIMHCTMQAPDQLVWVRAAKSYSPDPFQVKCVVANSGDLEAKNAEFRIFYDPADFFPISPISDVQPGTPPDVSVGQMSEALWNLRAKTRLTGDSAEVTIEASFDNHKTIRCTKRIWIAPTEPILECSIDDITLVADQDNQRYNPMPFDLNVLVTNRGGMKTDSVYATIILPPGDLALVNGPGDNTKRLTPMFLLPSQSGNVHWTLSHPITLVEKEYTVGVWTKTSNADSTLCQVKVTIPPLFAPILQAQCTVPNALSFDENIGVGGAYVPNPFTITLSAVNLSSMPAENVSTFVTLPEGVQFDPPGQNPRFDFGTLNRWQTGDPIPNKTWTVRYTKRPDTEQNAVFRFATGGVSAAGGVPLDTIYSACTTKISMVPPPFTCRFIGPDTLRTNASGFATVPNPFLLNYTVYNTSATSATLEEVWLTFPVAAGSLTAAPGNMQTYVVNQSISPGDSMEFQWEFAVKDNLTPGDIAFRATGRYETTKAIACQWTVHREAITTALACNLDLSQAVIAYDSSLQSYPDPTVTVTASLQNVGGWPHSGLQAELFVTDPGGFLEFDPAYPNNNPWTRPVLFGGQTVQPEWHFRLAKAVDSIPAQFVDFSVSYGSNEVPTVNDACNATVQINPVIHLSPVKVYSGEIPLPDSTNTAGGIGRPLSALYPRQGEGSSAKVSTYSIDQNYPNPFSTYTDITYSVADEADITLTVHNILGREVATLVDGSKKSGQYTVRLNAQSLPGGVYIVRMTAGNVSRSRVIMLQR